MYFYHVFLQNYSIYQCLVSMSVCQNCDSNLGHFSKIDCVRWSNGLRSSSHTSTTLGGGKVF